LKIEDWMGGGLGYQLARRRRTITLAQTGHQNFILKKSGLE
jgi:hypothetical protein